MNGMARRSVVRGAAAAAAAAAMTSASSTGGARSFLGHRSMCASAFVRLASRESSVIDARARRSSITRHQYATTAALPKNNLATWDGKSLSQSEFMERDTVLVTDYDDNLIGSASKKSSHEFSPSQPHGICHRAFSVFLFDASTDELLLQQRASTKITFPKVWTNTCCSHPLHGMEVSETDGPEDVMNGSVMGVKNAAMRKLEHELGIPMGELKREGFKFLTRVHYWAADSVTHGEKSPWGEHEIDYILFATVPSKSELTVKPNGEEVDDVRWVTQTQLSEMFDDATLLFSPWFRLIAKRWMMDGSDGNATGGWWDDLDRTMNTDDFCDYGTIHRFDPPREHLGGAGDAGPLFNVQL